MGIAISAGIAKKSNAIIQRTKEILHIEMIVKLMKQINIEWRNAYTSTLMRIFSKIPVWLKMRSIEYV